MTKKGENNKERILKILETKYFSICSFIILAVAIFWPTYWINFHEIPELRKQIWELSIENINISEEEKTIFETRFLNIENKYIDVLASKDTINFWLAVIWILIPFTLWYTIYQKWKTMEMADNEMKEIRKIKEKLQEDTKKDKQELKELKEQLSLEMNDLIENKVKEAIQDIDNESEKQRKITLLLNESHELYKKEEYKDALIIAEKIINLDKTNIFAYEIRWICLMYTDSLKKALNNFDKCIELDKSRWIAYYNKSCAYAYYEDVQESINNLKISDDLNYFQDEENRKTLYKDNDFDKIREVSEFKKFIKEFKKKYWDK